MTTLRRILTAGILVTAAAGVASANSIDFLSNVSEAPGGQYTLTLPGFNTDGGLYNLTGVTLYFAATENITTFYLTSTETANTASFGVAAVTNLVQSFTNSANSANKYTGETITTFDTGLSTNSALGSCSNVGPSATIPDGSCTDISLGPGATYTQNAYYVDNFDSPYGLNVGTGIGGLTGVVLNGTNIADYLASALAGGVFNLGGGVVSSESTTEYGSSAVNAQLTDEGYTQLQAEVDYTYTINNGAPEPATLMLMGGALLGLGLIGKKRFKKN